MWDGTGTVISVDGRLDSKGLGELERVCREAKAPLKLDLSELRSADDAAIEAIRKLTDKGTELTGLSPYISIRLGRTPG